MYERLLSLNQRNRNSDFPKCFINCRKLIKKYVRGLYIIRKAIRKGISHAY